MTPHPGDWIDRPRDDRGIAFVRRHGRDRWTYARLATLVHGEVARLQGHGIGPGDVVALGVPAGPAFLAALHAAWRIGAEVAPLPAVPVASRSSAVARLAGMLSAVRPKAVYVTDHSRSLLEDAMAMADPGAGPLLVLADRPEPGRAPVTAGERAGGETALLQFSSGTTGQPRAAELTHDNLASNVAAIRGWLKPSDADVAAIWLPPFHDMGLVGCLLLPVSAQVELTIMQPYDFVRRPLDWLRCFGLEGATLTATPAFTMRILLRQRDRMERGALAGWDFSAWRTWILGAERIDARLLGEVAEWLAPHGFDPATFAPAYGLAETTLAVTGTPMAVPPTILDVDRRSFRRGAPVDVRRVVGDASPRLPGDLATESVVGSGVPMPDTRVLIVDEDGAALPEGRVGEIAVAGPGVSQGYRTAVGFEPHAATASPACDGTLRTGDLGFVVGGELFVLSRLADWILTDGGGIGLEALEATLACLPGQARPPFALVRERDSPQRLVLLVEGGDEPWERSAADHLRTVLSADVDLAVVAVTPGTIERTTSGKIRRTSIAAGLELDAAPRPAG